MALPAGCGDDEDGTPPNRTERFEQTARPAAAYGGAGAWWTRTKGQLVAYSKNRILRIRVIARGFGDAEKRRAAARLGRLGFRRLSGSAS